MSPCRRSSFDEARTTNFSTTSGQSNRPCCDDGTAIRETWSCSCPFHRGSVFATARGAVALGAMKKCLLRRFHVGLLALPNLQCRRLYAAGLLRPPIFVLD